MTVAERDTSFTVRPGREPSRPGRRCIAGAATVAALIMAAASCGEPVAPADVPTADRTPPTINVAAAKPPNATSVKFTVAASDNLGLLAVHASIAAPGITGAFDTTFTSAVKSVSVSHVVSVPSSTTATVIAYAIDGAANQSRPDTLRIKAGTP